MLKNDILYLPVSLGEAIDKLTILDIKAEKISDIRKKDVLNEFNLLNEKLSEFIMKYKNLYETMKKVNLLIWNMMDGLRDGNLKEDEYLKVCKECIEYNDIRFRVKNKINNISKSHLKEQKSYKINRIIININKNINSDNQILLNIIKYLSFIYDEIILESNFSLEFLKDYFNYDNTIVFTNDLISKSETINFIKKVNIENKFHSNDDLYKLFNISFLEINKII
jgi:hypothetical protein